MASAAMVDDTDRLALRADAQDVRRASAWLERACDRHAVPAELLLRLDLCLNEVLANIIEHGGLSPASYDVALSLTSGSSDAQAWAALTITDRGRPFNPLVADPKPRPQSLADADVGGLGLQMLLNYADHLTYERSDDANRLTVVVRWAQRGGGDVPQTHKATFLRSPDRRLAVHPVAVERRISNRDRRDASLKWISLFRDCDESQVMAAIADCAIFVLEEGQTLLERGQANDKVFLLLSGQLAVYIGDPGAPDSVRVISPGECLGELSAIDHESVSATVKAMTQSRVLELSQDVFWQRLMAVPGVARDLMVMLSQRMRRNNDLILQAQRKQLELEYLRQELDVARQLQVGMLPLGRPMFPDRPEIEIAGTMESASMVGGDLFDAFFIDEQRLFFCVGDVSGHGIPAALFMARAVSLMRMAAFGAVSPGSLMAQVNEQLCAGNEANLFLTLFCGLLDVRTGRLTFANGGHLAPIHWRHGQVATLPVPKGTILGVIPGLTYTHGEIMLDEGDGIFCYTDGVTEAQTSAGEEFSESRLHGLLEQLASASLDHVLTHVRSAVTDFSGESRLADDCTMLAIRRSRY